MRLFRNALSTTAVLLSATATLAADLPTAAAFRYQQWMYGPYVALKYGF